MRRNQIKPRRKIKIFGRTGNQKIEGRHVSKFVFYKSKNFINLCTVVLFKLTIKIK